MNKGMNYRVKTDFLSRLKGLDTSTMTIGQIANSIGWPYIQTGVNLRRYGIKYLLESNVGIPLDKKKKVVKFLVAQGFGFKDISKLFGCSRQSVHQLYSSSKRI